MRPSTWILEYTFKEFQKNKAIDTYSESTRHNIELLRPPPTVPIFLNFMSKM